MKVSQKCAHETLIQLFCPLKGATLRLIPTAPISEGSSGEVCATLETIASNILGVTVLVTLNITDGTAGMLKL